MLAKYKINTVMYVKAVWEKQKTHNKRTSVKGSVNN